MIPRDVLERFAPKPGPETPSSKRTAPVHGTFDLPRWMERNGAALGEYREKQHAQYRHLYVLKVCPFNPEHAADEIHVHQKHDGALGAGCKHDSCTWGWTDLRQKIEPGYRVRGVAATCDDPSPEKELAECVLNLKELFILPLRERTAWFPWLPEGALVMIYGPRGIGKTFFSLSSAVSLACGTSFLRWSAPESPVGVLYVDGEMPLGAMRQRVADLMPHIPPAEGLFRFLPGEHVYTTTKRDLRLSDPGMREAVSDILTATPEIRVVILDNISCLFSGLDEDKKKEWETVVPWLLSLRHRSIAVILVHHAGKGGDQRGTSGREDLLDTVIRLDRPHDSRAEDGARFVVRFTKSRGVTGEAVADFEASLIRDEAGALAWEWKPVQESNLDKLLRAVADGADMQAELPDELGLTKGAVSKLVKKARDLGLLTPGDRNKPLKLTDKGLGVVG